MEVSQGNSLCSYIKQAKCHFFFLSFAKSENRNAEQVLPMGFDTNEMREEMGDVYKRVNMVQILCRHEEREKRYLLKLFFE
jgi:hypothetical protein